jgi:hypothetical protein
MIDDEQKYLDYVKSFFRIMNPEQLESIKTFVENKLEGEYIQTFCGCGKRVRYDVADGKQACNKYMRCLTREEAVEALKWANMTILRAEQQIFNSYDVPSPDELRKLDNKGFESTLECMIHEIWKGEHPSINKDFMDFAKMSTSQVVKSCGAVVESNAIQINTLIELCRKKNQLIEDATVLLGKVLLFLDSLVILRRTEESPYNKLKELENEIKNYLNQEVNN